MAMTRDGTWLMHVLPVDMQQALFLLAHSLQPSILPSSLASHPTLYAFHPQPLPTTVGSAVRPTTQSWGTLPLP